MHSKLNQEEGKLRKLTKHKIKRKRKKKKVIEEPSSIFRKRRRFQLNNNLLISREESERRLQVGCLGLAFTLSFLCSLLLIICSQSLHNCEPFIFRPNITVPPNLFGGYPVQHVALIYMDGSVYDISMEENISPSKKLLLTLPKDQFYMGYQDQIGILYLMSSRISSRLITKYHTIFGDKTIPSSVIPNKITDSTGTIDSVGSMGVQVGALFWVIGHKNYKIHDNVDATGTFMYQGEPISTWIWFVKRQKWRQGPLIPDIDEFAESTSAAINGTTAMVMFNQDVVVTRVYDFANEKLIHYPILNYWEPNTLPTGISLTVLITKSKRMAYFKMLLLSLNGPGDLGSTKSLLFSYDLDLGSNGQWNLEYTSAFGPMMANYWNGTFNYRNHELKYPNVYFYFSPIFTSKFC